MTHNCPDGHQSTDADFCSVCGVEMPKANAGASAPAAAPAAAAAPTDLSNDGPECPNCHKKGNKGDSFCQFCGTDYDNGSAPPAPAVTPAATAGGASTSVPAPAGKQLVVLSEVDTTRLEEARKSESDFREPSDLSQHTFVVTAETAIGRKTDNAIMLGDAAVSSHHAKLVVMPDGSFGLQDTGSTNGTRLNGTPMVGAEVKPLKSGDVIELGFFSKLTIQ